MVRHRATGLAPGDQLRQRLQAVPTLLGGPVDAWYLKGIGVGLRIEEMLTVKSWMTKLNALFADGRRRPRLKTRFQASLSGSFGSLSVTGSDMNRTGAGVQSESAVPAGSLVFLRIANLGLFGFARVKHCSPSTEGFRLGLEFREPLYRSEPRENSWQVQQLSLVTGHAWNEAQL